MWNELSVASGHDEGAHNFITGAGGFMQSILNGYAGLKVRMDGLHIDRPLLPVNVTRLSLTGMFFVVVCGCEWWEVEYL